MLYTKYQMYDERMEIMVPSHLKMTETFLAAQYNWMSDDKKVIINVMRGGSDLEEEELYLRLEEYYKGFRKDTSNFECLHIAKRSVNGYSYGELRYTSDMMGYRFYTIFMLGSFEGRELVLTLQCMDKDAKENLDRKSVV